jgi:ADP-dependent NAD(P)H-hydrate dehydratase
MSTREPVVVTPRVLRDWPLPQPSGSKNDRGVVLIVGGSRETPGAVVLAGEAALRAGAGKLQVATVESRAGQVGVALPEALVRPLPETSAGGFGVDAAKALADLASAADAVLVGPGMLGADDAADLVAAVVGVLGPRSALVVDALALAAFGAQGGVELGPDVAARTVLTPNIGELARVLDAEPATVGDDVAGHAGRLSRRVGAVVHAGGEVSMTVAPDGRCWRDDHGDDGLGVSGSGDVLAGVTAGLLARGAQPAQAAVWAAHLHAVAGRRLATRVGDVGFLAREIAAEIAPALRQLG